jgi:hypothetical protein
MALASPEANDSVRCASPGKVQSAGKGAARLAIVYLAIFPMPTLARSAASQYPRQLAVGRIGTQAGLPGQGKHGARGPCAWAKAERDGSFGEGRSWSDRNRGNRTTKDCPHEQHTVDRPGDRDREILLGRSQEQIVHAADEHGDRDRQQASAMTMNRTISPRSVILRVDAPDTA